MKINKNPVLIKNDNFSCVLVEMIFPIVLTKEEIPLFDFIPSMLTEGTFNYPSKDEMTKECLKRNVASQSCEAVRYNNLAYLSFNLRIPALKYFKEDIFSDACDLFFEFIYKPLAKDNLFDEEVFKLKMRQLKASIANSKKNISSSVFQKVINLIDDKGYYKANVFNDNSLLDTITNERVYKLYEKVISKAPIVFVMGDITNKHLEVFNPYIKDDTEFWDYKTNYLSKTSKSILDVHEHGNFNQSELLLVYKLKEHSPDDEYLLSLLDSLLSSGSSRILFKNLRKETGLVYNASSSHNSFAGTFYIYALTDKSKKEQALKQIYKSLDELEDEETVEKLLDNIKERRKLALESYKDDRYAVFENNVGKILGTSETNEERYKIIEKIHAKDIKNFIKKLDLDLIFFMEGDKDGE